MWSAARVALLGIAALFSMAFTYHSCDGTQNAIDFVRLLIADTQDLNHVFEDSEILAFYTIQGNVFQSGMFYSFPSGSYVPTSPVSYLRVAAVALDSIASNKARLSSITQLLDVKLSPNMAAKALHDQAQSYRDVDDDSGAIFIIEQCPTEFAFVDRWFNQWQRLGCAV